MEGWPEQDWAVGRAEAVKESKSESTKGGSLMGGEVVMDRNGKKLIRGHVLDVLAGLPAASVQCIVTSPPY